jgi:hypothetical protein
MERAYDRVGTGRRIEVEMMINGETTHGNINNGISTVVSIAFGVYQL